MERSCEAEVAVGEGSRAGELAGRGECCEGRSGRVPEPTGTTSPAASVSEEGSQSEGKGATEGTDKVEDTSLAEAGKERRADQCPPVCGSSRGVALIKPQYVTTH